MAELPTTLPPKGKPSNDRFASKRLVFRAADRPEFDKFWDMMFQDGYFLSMADPNITHLYPAEKIKAARKRITEALLGVVVCLKPSDYDKVASERYDDKFNEIHKPFPVGFIAMFKSTQKHETAEIGVSMSEGHRGQGYGTETIEWALKWGFEVAGLARVEIATGEYNPVAYALYKKLGFVEEGFERQSLFKDGRRWGWHKMAMLKDEWLERQAKK